MFNELSKDSVSEREEKILKFWEENTIFEQSLEQRKDAPFFSFYDVCEKVGLVVGTFSFGLIEGLTGSMRNSILVVGAFFVVGLIILFTVPKEEVNLVKT